MELDNLKNKKIGVLMGGFSSEREISLRSGKNVLNILKSAGYNAIAIDVQENFLDVLKQEKIDVAFNVLHGKFGEDGRIQSILDFLKIPYTGSGFEASSIAINKVLSKQTVSLYGVATAPFQIIKSQSDFDRISFPLPWIIKPIDEGSSIGVQIIKDKKQSLKYDLNKTRYFVEQFIEGTEITIGVLDNGHTRTVLPILQLAPKNEFYDFESKYTKGMTNFILPAKLPEAIYKKAQDFALRAHEAIECSGATRSDFIVNDSGIYFLEINTNPGMTETSDIPEQAKAQGLSLITLCEEILKSAFARKK